MVLAMLILGAFIFRIKIDTDPENMLSESEAVRIFHHTMKQEFSLNDMVVIGVINDQNPDGVFNPESLKKIYELTEYAKSLRWPDPNNPGKKIGVIEIDILSPSTVDNIEPGGLGTVRFDWLMPKPPQSREEAIAIRDKAQRIPFLNGTLLSEDGKALCLYLPLTSKDLSYKVYSLLKEKIAALENGNERYFITGLPVAEDTFGVEMFIQMAVSAPLAMLVIFLLMLYFFRKLILIIAPMIVAIVSVTCTMGLLIGTGHTVHIMSSMIPIFIMPISVLDSIHILSEFFDRYQKIGGRRQTIFKVMDELFMPMLYTSLTSAAGFASLALTPIPPVQVFGIFVALGVMLAWFFTITFIPAYIMFIPAKAFQKFGLTSSTKENDSLMTRFLSKVGSITFNQAKIILPVTIGVVMFAVLGISRIQINDNPTKWFSRSHPIRVADSVLNEHFGGTYMAYLVLEPQKITEDMTSYRRGFTDRLGQRFSELKEDYPLALSVFNEIVGFIQRHQNRESSPEAFLESLAAFAADKLDQVEGEAAYTWEEASLFVDEQKQLSQAFKDPGILAYIADLQKALLKTGVVGKSNSLADIVKTVHRDLLMGQEEAFRIPQSRKAVAQCLLTFQNSHRPHDLWHFVTPDYRKTSLWVQLKSGDNQDMERVVEAVDEHIQNYPPPLPLTHNWFGLTYINVVWQEKMVKGMLLAFMGSFLIVFLMTSVLFRSTLWALLSMIPLTVTVIFIYGVVGIVGKDYDMPVAVLSSLSLGLSVDFAIHFLTRSRNIYPKKGSWEKASKLLFGEPARAISRNIMVIAFGFMPLLAATLVPYKTVGIFLASIMVVSGVATLIILPSLVKLLGKKLFPPVPVMGSACNCVLCIASSITVVFLIAINFYQYSHIGFSALTWISLIAIPLLVLGCGFMSRREKCKIIPPHE